MVARTILAGLALTLGLLLAHPAWAGDIEGHVYLEEFAAGQPGVYDPGIDIPAMEPVLLTQIGFMDRPPRPGETIIDQFLAFPDADGFYEFSNLPPGGIFQIDLPGLSPIVAFGANIITVDETGMKVAEPVPPAPDGIPVVPGSTTTVDIPILAASAPGFTYASPQPRIVVGGIFVDRNPGGETGGCGFGRRGTGCTLGNQEPFGVPAENVEVVLQGLDAAGVPVGAPLTTIVGSEYTFTPEENLSYPTGTYSFEGLFMFLDKSVADGESVRITIDPSQAAFAGLAPVSETSIVRTYDASPDVGEDSLPTVEFRFQPVFALGGNVKVERPDGTTVGLPNIEIQITDVLDGRTIDPVVTDANGDYAFPDLFNSLYLVTVVGTGGQPNSAKVRLIENEAPLDADFCFDQANCPDGIAPTIVAPDDITEECASPEGNIVSWSAIVSDDVTPSASIEVAYQPYGPGDTIPLGLHQITITATDWCGNTATESFSIQVVDTTPPKITAGQARQVLWVPNRKLRNIGLTASATDICAGGVPVSVTVYSNQMDSKPQHSPDATIGDEIGSLSLRAERRGKSAGRIYLIVLRATDGTNSSTWCSTVIVPKGLAPLKVLLLMKQAALLRSKCKNGVTPAGLHVILPETSFDP